MNDKSAVCLKPGATVYSVRYGPMIVNEVQYALGLTVFGIVVSAATDRGKQILEYDSGANFNRALFEVHDLQLHPTFACWLRDVKMIARDRYIDDEPIRPTMEYYLCYLSGWLPIDAYKAINDYDDDDDLDEVA